MRINLQIKDPPRFLFMGLLILLVGTYISMLINRVSSVDDYSERTDPQTATPTRPVKYDIERISKIFGTPQQEEHKNTEIKESALSLKLVASYVVGKNRHSAAVLEQDGGKQKLYFSGDLIIPGVKLKSIEARRVLIQREQATEQISLITPPSRSNKQLSSIDTASFGAPSSVGVSSIVEGSAELDAMLDMLREDKRQDMPDRPSQVDSAL